MNNYILVTKYWYWLIAVGVFLLLFLITNLALLYYRKKKILANLSDFCDKKGYRLTVVKRKTYDYIIEVGEKKFFIKTAFVPLNAAITINSKDTWNLAYGGSKNRPGRGYSRQRYLDELIGFLRGDFPGVKVVLIYPTIDKVQRYLNESEIVILTYKDAAHGIRFITYQDWDRHFGDLI